MVVGVVLTRSGVAEGMLRVLPLTLFAMAFGLAFGAAAAERGLDTTLAVAMSATVFAGASQFAVLDMWREPLPYLSLALLALAVNARHLIYGAVLSPWLNALPVRKRLLSLFFLTDVSFADTHLALRGGAKDVGLLLGGGVTLWATWTIGTLVGAGLGSSMGSPAAFGIDVVMIAFFAALVTGELRRDRRYLPVMVAAVVAVAAQPVVPHGWNVILAALAGGLTGAFRDA